MAVVYAWVVTALKAHVVNGRIVVDEPVDLPDGAEVYSPASTEKSRTWIQPVEMESPLPVSSARRRLARS